MKDFFLDVSIIDMLIIKIINSLEIQNLNLKKINKTSLIRFFF